MRWAEELKRLLRRVGRERPVEEEPGGIPCHVAAKNLQEWLDGELDPGWADRVGAHLEACARCYPVLLFERSFRKAVARAAADERAPDELKERILASLEEIGYAAPAGQDESPPGEGTGS